MKHNQKYRIVFCCQASNILNKEIPKDVKKVNWSRSSGYAQQKKSDRHTELFLLSKACLYEKEEPKETESKLEFENIFS